MAGEMRDTPLNNWQHIFEANLPPILTATDIIYTQMRQRGYGSIIDTPLYDRATYNRVKKDRALKLLRKDTSTQQASTAAQRIIKQVAKNRPIIQTAVSTKLAWLVFKLSPRFYEIMARRILRRYRTSLREQ